ncbi:hypothetical protein ACOME3_006120 [Neoechinorhynchus agilis]
MFDGVRNAISDSCTKTFSGACTRNSFVQTDEIRLGGLEINVRDELQSIERKLEDVRKEIREDERIAKCHIAQLVELINEKNDEVTRKEFGADKYKYVFEYLFR